MVEEHKRLVEQRDRARQQEQERVAEAIQAKMDRMAQVMAEEDKRAKEDERRAEEQQRVRAVADRLAGLGGR